MNTALTDIFGPVIHAYTAQQAVEDGVLVDVAQLGEEFTAVAEYLQWPAIPVYLTSALFGILEDAAERGTALIDLWIHVAVQAHNFAPLAKAFAEAGQTGQGWGAFSACVGGAIRDFKVSANVEGITIMLEEED